MTTWMRQDLAGINTNESNREIMVALRDLFTGRKTEAFVAVFLDKDGKVQKGLAVMAEGNRMSVQTPYADMLATAKALGTKYMVLAHNHPKQEALDMSFLTPSGDDILVASSTAMAMADEGITVVDSFIFGEGGDFLSIGHTLANAENPWGRSHQFGDAGGMLPKPTGMVS